MLDKKSALIIAVLAAVAVGILWYINGGASEREAAPTGETVAGIRGADQGGMSATLSTPGAAANGAGGVAAPTFEHVIEACSAVAGDPDAARVVAEVERQRSGQGAVDAEAINEAVVRLGQGGDAAKACVAALKAEGFATPD